MFPLEDWIFRSFEVEWGNAYRIDLLAFTTILHLSLQNGTLSHH